MVGSDVRALLTGAFRAAVERAQPRVALPPHLPEPPAGRLVIVGAGKAAAEMARVAEEHYGARHPDVPFDGVVVTRYGHGARTRSVAVLEAAHPVPDAAGVAATERILALTAGLGPRDLLLCLLSGGGSALLCSPDGVTLDEKAALTAALLRSGASIHEMNAVRKHLSRVKGGRLARAAAPARVVAVAISDVVGDDPGVIASGPTAPDPTTFTDALAILDRYGIVADGARGHLAAGARGERNETPKPGDACFARVENRVIASAADALEAARAYLGERGVVAHVLDDAVVGEARDAAREHAAVVRRIRAGEHAFRAPCVLLSGGETTVTVRGAGRGGRNGEFLLALALELHDHGIEGVRALAADTDGIDGSETNAGAFFEPEALEAAGVALARAHLADNDAFGFFESTGGLVQTGPTRTNVNDFRAISIE